MRDGRRRKSSYCRKMWQNWKCKAAARRGAEPAKEEHKAEQVHCCIVKPIHKSFPREWLRNCRYILLAKPPTTTPPTSVSTLRVFAVSPLRASPQRATEKGWSRGGCGGKKNIRALRGDRRAASQPSTSIEPTPQSRRETKPVHVAGMLARFYSALLPSPSRFSR